jgi:uncharacterized protein YhfF
MVKRIAVAVHGKGLEKSGLFPISWLKGRLFFQVGKLPVMTFPIVNGLRTVEFGNPGESRDKLISLILDGNKRATAGTLEWDYIEENEPIETVGEKLAVLDNHDQHIATIQATRVEVRKFAEVPDEFALAEAEGDLNGDDFRESHYGFWSKLGLPITDDTEIVLVYFDLIEDLRKR